MTDIIITLTKLGLVADPVIEAIVRLEFEDGLRTTISLKAAGALRAAVPHLGSIPNPPGGAGWSWGSVVVIGTLLSDQIPVLLSSAHRWC